MPATTLACHPSNFSMDQEPATVDVPREFQRRRVAIIDDLNVAIKYPGLQDISGYVTDHSIRQQRGLQTLVLKSRNRSAYVRLNFDTVVSDADADRQRVDAAVKSAIAELT